jgi:hypothetical protein
MLRGVQERVCLRLEIFDADPSVGSKDAGKKRAHLGVVSSVVLGYHLAQPAVITLICGLPGLAIS